MLIATPYRDFDVSPPKIISEIRKNYSSCTFPNAKPKLSGDLLLKCGNDKNWWPRKVHIRGGQLHVSSLHGPENSSALRLPLRHLSLQAGPLPNSLSLCRGQNIILTLQTSSVRDFDQWVKTIAIELIRQTPLDSIKYLDILTIAECWKRQKCEKDWNYNYIHDVSDYEAADEPEETVQNTSTQSEPVSDKEKIHAVAVIEEKAVEDLLKKCQNAENYVPVKEKLFLFESLCKLGRKVRSTEDVSNRVTECCTKRARSMHDLSNINSHIAVREICRYFEKKSDKEETVSKVNNRTRRRMNDPDSNLANIYTFRKVMTT